MSLLSVPPLSSRNYLSCKSLSLSPSLVIRNSAQVELEMPQDNMWVVIPNVEMHITYIINLMLIASVGVCVFWSGYIKNIFLILFYYVPLQDGKLT